MNKGKTTGRRLIFSGDGKGKTTAALGMALRASGHGLRVLVIQFIKGRQSAGEHSAVMGLPNIEIIQSGHGFTPALGSAEYQKHQHAAKGGLDQAIKALRGGGYDVVILDEVCTAIAKGLLTEYDVLQVCDQQPLSITLVLTGRYATAGLLEWADTATEMRCIRHAYQRGMPAQAGIEF